MIETPSPNFNARPDGVQIDTLVIHYTGMATGDAALARLCDPTAEVSAHYLIEEDGTLHKLVEEENRAWHAGVASWRGVTDINGCSIGIELVNPGHEFGYRSFPAAQMECLIGLCKGIMARHPIEQRNVLGHSDVAPSRKQDPGELFNWHELAGQGIGLWPNVDPQSSLSSDPYQLLEHIGYDVSDRTASVLAFQRHFRPDLVDGVLDSGTCACLESAFMAVSER